MRNIKLLVILSLTVVVIACKVDPSEPHLQEECISTFYLIRLYEKYRSDPDNIDPELNQDGLGRAMRWAGILDAVDLDAIYITDIERTAMTTAPTSVKKEIT